MTTDARNQKWSFIFVSFCFATTLGLYFVFLNRKQNAGVELFFAGLCVIIVTRLVTYLRHRSKLFRRNDLRLLLVYCHTVLTFVFAFQAIGFGEKGFVFFLKIAFLFWIFYWFARPNAKFKAAANVSVLFPLMMPLVSGYFFQQGFSLIPLYAIYLVWLSLGDRRFRFPKPKATFFWLWIYVFVGFLVLSIPFAWNKQDSAERLGFTLYLVLLFAWISHQYVGIRGAKILTMQLVFCGLPYIAISLALYGIGLFDDELGWALGKVVRKGNIITTHIGLHFLGYTLLFHYCWIWLRHQRRRITLLWILSIAVFVLAFARASLFAYMLVTPFVILTILAYRNRWERYLRPAFIASLLLLVASVSVVYVLFPQIFSLRSLEVRGLFWNLAMDNVVESPWIGSGNFQEFRLFTIATNTFSSTEVLTLAKGIDPWVEPHNTYVSVLTNFGVLGSLLIGSLVLYWIRLTGNFSGSSQSRSLAYSFLGTLFAILIAGLAESWFVNYIALFWFFLHFAVLGVAATRLEKQSLGRVHVLSAVVVSLIALGASLGYSFFSIGQDRLLHYQPKILDVYRPVFPMNQNQTDYTLTVKEDIRIAEENLEKSSIFYPMNAQQHQFLAEIELAKLKVEKNANRRKELWENALAHYQKAILLNQRSPNMYFRLSDIYREIGVEFSGHALERAEEKKAYGKGLDPYSIYEEWFYQGLPATLDRDL